MFILSVSAPPGITSRIGKDLLTMSYETIGFEIDGGVATLTLDRPDCLNSFNDRMHDEVRDALRHCEREDAVRCLLLTGTGRGFCAGQDLSERHTEPGGEAPDLGASVEQHYNPLIRKLKSLSMPVVCAVNGVAAGAGANIAFACDIVLAARSASFIEAFCRIGLIPDSGGTWHLPRLVGHARAMGMALLGDRICAEQAERWGLIWKCLPDEELMTEANRLASHLATRPTRALALTKRALHASWSNPLDRQLELERDFMRIAGRTDDYREGVAAFLEKREAKFQGK